MNRCFPLAVVLILTVHLVFGQQNIPYFHHISVENGLSNAINVFIYKDSRGFVWLSSTSGLNRFDGQSIRVYQPDKEDPNSMFGQNIQSPFFELKNGDLLFGTYIGLNRYNRATDHFDHFELPPQPGGGKLSYYYGFYLTPDEKLWMFLDGREIYQFDTKTEAFTFIQKSPFPIHRIRVLTGAQGDIRQIWGYSLYTPGLFVGDWQQDSFEFHSYFLHEKDPVINFREIQPVNDTLTWMASDSGLMSFNVRDGSIQYYDTWNGKNVQSIKSMAPLGKDSLLLFSETNGLITFDKSRKKFSKLISTSLSDQILFSETDQVYLNHDHDGGIWISQLNLGVDYFYPDKLKFGKILPDPSVTGKKKVSITSILEDSRNQVWCGTDNGVYVFDTRMNLTAHYQYHPEKANTLPPRTINQIIEDEKGRIWALSFSGISVWHPETKEFQRILHLSNVPLFGCRLKDNSLVFSGIQGGLFRIDDKSELIQLVNIPEMEGKGIYSSLFLLRNGLLMGCREVTSVVVIDPENDFEILATLDIPGESNTYFEDPADGSIWITNSYGLVQVSPDFERFKIYNEKDGLPAQHLMAMLPDKKGTFWISSNNGMISFDPKSQDIHRYSLSDGIPSYLFNRMSALRISNGEFWFGTNNGIAHFKPEHIVPISIPAHPTITSILVNDQEPENLFCTESKATNVSELKNIHLSYLENTLSFTFSALEYSDPASNQFQYMMEGVDKGWVECGTRNFTRYARLPYGQYRFLLKASNSDGIWSDPAVLKIYIEPPFWLKWWFILLEILFVAGIAWGIYFVREKRKEKLRQMEREKKEALEQERQRIARDVHDDLGSGLSALSLVSEFARNKTTPEELREEIEKISRSARDLSGKIQEVIWTVSAKNDTLPNLISYLNQYAVDLLDNAGLDPEITLPDQIPSAVISGEHRRTVFLAFKEALNNILKHAGATRVKIEFTTNDQQLVIAVSDNGKGFDPALLEKSTGNGLLNMRTRMKDIGGNCTFDTSREGTLIRFSIPFHPK